MNTPRIKNSLTMKSNYNKCPFWLERLSTLATLAVMAGVTCISTFAAEPTGGRYTDRVNLFLGTNSSAQCSPAAIRPFGMISPGPLNQPKAPSGYAMRVNKLIGFNHTHLQGTGCGSYGVLVLLPTTGNKELGTTVEVPSSKQSAEPGYFKADIAAMKITAEMTATKRSAIHRYTFPKSDSARVLIDLSKGIFWADKKPGEIKGTLSEVSPTTFRGSVKSTAWREHTTYFYMEFSKPVTFTGKGEAGGYVNFTTTGGEAVLVKLGISYVSAENAKLNLTSEIPGWDFDTVRKGARDEWEQELAKIDVQGGTKDQQAIFYSSMYHLMFHPQLFNDVNGDYLGMDGKVHQAQGHNHYSVLSMWDTFRAAHPLYTLIAPDLQLDVIKTMLDDYRDSGWGPLWKLANKETSIMPGTWADVIISDSYVKGITSFDTDTAWKLVKKNATEPGRRNDIKDYLALGYVPSPAYINASRTLENAYCDFTIGKYAEALGQKQDATEYFARGMNYKKLWDSETQFFRGKDKEGNWSYPDAFSPLTYTGNGNNDYCEGNAWQWTWHVMQDTQGLINLMGGDAAFEKKLDTFFNLEGDKNHTSPGHGQYWHGNEPDQHAIYAYNYVGAPAKAAEKLRQCLASEYRNDSWGMSGNEDAGQMSAWYIFSALGFYPYVHAVPEYAIGSPLFDQATLHMRGGDFVIKAKNNSAENKYVQSVTLNGKPWDKTFLPHSALVKGGTMEFEMGPSPSSWGTAPEARPYSMTARQK